MLQLQILVQVLYSKQVSSYVLIARRLYTVTRGWVIFGKLYVLEGITAALILILVACALYIFLKK